ncbi:MAG TPA: hypothetical protein VFS37_12475 [Conexibacter sp.]|nr:hypothetical protein [Conexibacter sp.]
MAVLNLRTAAAVALGVGIGAAIARRRAAAAEPCCEQPTTGASCC